MTREPDCGHLALIASGEAQGLCPLCQRDEIERLRAESEAFRGKLAEQCGQTLVAHAEVERLQVLYKDRGDLLDLKNVEIEQLRALLRRHHLRGAYWDNELAVETRAALEKKP